MVQYDSEHEYCLDGRFLTVRFNGYLYKADTGSSNSGRKYLCRRVWDKERKCTGKTEYFHRAVWEWHNGAIPEGMDVHHKDHNIYNNVIGNLELMPSKEHASLHLKEARSVAPEVFRARAKKAKLHTIVQHTCKQCGVLFENNSHFGSFCSKDCYDKYRTKTCPCCGKQFIYTHKKQVCCSIACKHKYFGNDKLVDTVCAWCGKPVKDKYTHYKMHKAAFCCAECRRQSINKHNRERYHKNKCKNKS